MNKKVLYVIIVILAVIIIGGLFFFLGNKNAQKEVGNGQKTSASPSTAAQTPATDTTMVDCTGTKDPSCFLGRMSGCLPVTAKMTGTDNSAIEITILGIENDTCHFQRKINGALNLDCFFPKGTLSWDTIDQTFGNDKGLQKVV
ncbi:MAG: hypothetical protein NTY61_01485, partial [Candidatus Parcubacteria bacterium]|nr:hypothetical protein [Candidatus Parcubacteria bacterium]